jgi:ketosteroid isomerase-like protein
MQSSAQPEEPIVTASSTAADSGTTTDVINRFNEVFNQHDVDGVMALMTDDVVFENTFPAPDGERFVGQEAGRAFWSQFFAGSPSAHFEAEDMFAAGDRCAVRWRYTWTDDSGNQGHIRGVDIFKVRDGKVSEKLAYVKG